MTDLTVQACWSLLREAQVGRLAVVADGLPEIFPVTFLVDHGSLVVRTGPGTKLSTAVHRSAVAFEVDGYDPAGGEAWSVIAKGTVELVQSMQEMVDVVALPLFPWHAGPKPCYLRIVPGELTGRRFVVAPAERELLPS